MGTREQLVFRVNRDVVVLNDTLSGRLWLPRQDPEVREPNWQDVEREEETENTAEETESREATTNLQAECSAESASPVANDDDYGVRAGRTMILSVIDNDSSSDCGILAISEHDPLPAEFGTLTPVYGGRALQLTTAADATGTAELTYTISDGRGSSAPSTATVRLTVRDPGDNAAPEQVRVGAMLVEQGASATYHVLPDFQDPDGDHLVLAGGVTAAGGTVRTRQDGEVTFTSDGATLGRQTVTVLVSDGVETVEGTLHVDVRPAGSLPPVVDPVHAQTYVDSPVTVRPLDAVRSVSREPVRLAGVDEVPGATIETDLSSGTFSFSAPNPGSYYVTFTLTASPQQVVAIARIDVLARPETVPPPTAVLDVALLPPGGEVTIDPLANDEDPAGGVLVVQSVEVPEGTGLRVAIRERQLLQILSERVLAEPVVLRYTISNGTASATGDVLVQPIPASATQQPPVVPDAKASVRTGGVVTIPVLERAYDPDGDQLTLVPTLVEAPSSGQGLMFVSGEVLRFRAPDSPMDVRATFEVRDSAGNVTAANVTVTVHAADPEAKSPPRPRALTARVFSGETVRIEVPLVGIDPDGDGVTLLGQAQAPTKGRIVDRGANWLEYEALPGEVGTDTFTYAVEDWVGQRATATVRVGIAERPPTAAEVFSRNDDVTVRPGQTIEVRVLANDRATGGAELSLAPELEVPDGVVARVQDRRIVVETPEQEGVLHIGYTALNDRGGRDSALLTVTVVDDAPFLPPVARDVVVPAEETINRTSVEVDVLELAQNPSGPLSDLEVSVLEQDEDVATVTASGTVVVTLVDTPQTLPYRLTNTHPDADGVRSYAFITVPALGDFPPVPRPRAPELRVIAGEELRIPLAEQVQVAPGKQARVVDATTVTATKSDGSQLWVDGETLRYVAQRSYAGPASISFEVTDGAGLGSRSTFMTLPITVLAAEDYPPTFTPSVLDVAPDESNQVDLRSFTSAPVETAEGTTRYTYRLTSAPPPGFTVTLDGSVLTVSAAATARKGTVGGVGLEIGYGTDRAIPAQVDFRVIASTRQLARVLDHRVPDGVEGGASTVAVLAGAYNPFPDRPLTVVDAVVETPGAGEAGVSGDRVTVRPVQGFIGQMVTRYRVRDVTGDPDREVEGRVIVTVRGRPSTPTAPRVSEVRDGAVVLAWDAPANNGAEIEGYTLTRSPGGATTSCPSTTCTVDALTNDVEYTFTVTARNAVGTSDASPASAPARPDVRPAAPGAPRLEWGNGSVTATWTAPENNGSPIERYDLEISPAPPGGSASAQTASTSHTFSGLANGTAYSVRVRAVNRAPDPGDWSAMSASVVPAAPPDAPALSAQRYNQSIFGGGSLEVTWADPANNGDAISGYEIRVDGGNPQAPSSRNRHVVDPARPGSYTFQVRALNKAGAGAWSAVLDVPYATVPSQVTGLSATSPNAGAVELSFGDPDWAGGQNRRFEVAVNGGAWATLGSRTVTGLEAGGYSFVVRACNEVGCGAQSNSASATVTTAPGPVTPGSVTFSGRESFQATWSAAATGGLTVTYEYQWREGYYRDRLLGGRDIRWDDWTTGQTGGTSLSHAIADDVTTNGGVVQVRVRASNDRGTTAWTDVFEGVLPVPEDPPPGGGETPP
nr:Ig-like domain-containing protein [Cellulomonas sp. APG4]